MGSFFSSLVGTYANVALQRQQVEQSEQDKDRAARVNILTSALASPNFNWQDPTNVNAVLDQLGELTGGGGKGKGKGGKSSGIDHLRTIFERLRGQVPKQAGLQQPLAVNQRSFLSPEQVAEQQGRTSLLSKKPELDYQAKMQEERDKRLEAQREAYETERERAAEELQDKRDQAAAARADFNAQMQNFRQQRTEAFQMSMEGLRTRAATARLLQQQGSMDARAYRTVLSSSLNNTLSNLRSQQMKAAQIIQARQKDAQGLMQRMPVIGGGAAADVKAAQNEYNGTQRAIQFIESQRGAILSGKADMDDIVDKANQMVLMGGADPTGLTSLKPK